MFLDVFFKILGTFGIVVVFLGFVAVTLLLISLIRMLFKDLFDKFDIWGE